ncbi:NAD(P)-dependent methylenetetrahydromethanopterin dehydrogenase [Calycomorphotria hydatis]|uniref:Bifunctional protein MdtA n=1 Tax=Calycomorphotria hydatis TaxID=2528027 RepID=A0A517TAB4_9PLAN|nr:NAD(P)-dependent methylenetetrahydromethanopterin dehydrogenase [Calycomorphotria hydatis]QDT65309.1 Bifunctional protein MdtA [Calycomorphotria hydatis]
MKNLLIQLDPDRHPSSFDQVVAYDGGAKAIMSYGDVQPEDVEALVHGAIFTRGPKDLHHTAIFVGGTDLERADLLAEKVQKTFFGPMRVSLMVDPNGSNTTAAAAVVCLKRHVKLAGLEAVVFGGTGPVGERVVRLLTNAGANVRITSRQIEKAQEVADRILKNNPDAKVTAVATSSPEGKAAAVDGVEAIVAAGAAGVQFLKEGELEGMGSLKVAIDLNAVPPVGIGGVPVTASAEKFGKVLGYGAIGVGGYKMKIHKACIQRLFDRNDQALMTDSIYQVAVETCS